jgi:RNA polymerase sigma-54 factor
MEKVARIIVREQRAFFLGEYSLLPLRIEDAALEIGVHETTVYRALQGKYLCCTRGTFPLAHFFQKEVSGGVSTQRVKEMILDICRGDTKLSDRAIADALKARGVSLSRRTVAKYRAQMNIDSSFRRSAEEKE